MNKHQHFIIIGAQRSGTTLLYELMDRHPEVCMARPVRPEPKYFLNEQVSKEEYLSGYFTHRLSSHRFLGEKSTSYYEFPEVAHRIHAVLPDVKLIFLARNPVDRALSNYFFSVQHSIETRTLKQVFLERKPPPLIKQTLSVNPFDYLKRGDYAALLKPYDERFGNRLKPVLFEYLINGRATGELNEFLDLEISIDLSGQIINASDRDHVPDEVIDHLTSYYRPKVEALEEQWNIDLNLWK
ncbi:MAG: sulfotransferase [Salibacteraceae bacterium]